MSDTDPHIRTIGDVVAEFPASTTQQRAWFLDRVKPGNTALNVAVRWEFRGTVSADSIERAFAHVIDRHEVLRTRLVERDGALVQQVVAYVPFKLGRIDIPATDEAEALRRIDTIAQEDAARAFDLTQPGMIRTTLVRFSPERAILLIVVHQSIFDGFSIRVLGEEIGKATAAFEAGRQPDLPDLPLQFGDFALWQKELLECGVMEEEAAYWQETLKDAPYFEIEPDKPRPAERSTDAGKIVVNLPEDFGPRLKEAAQAASVSPFAFGAAVVSGCLHRLTGARDVLMGVQVAGRTEVDLEPLIGVFINNVVLRFHPEPDCAFADHLASARRVIEGALSHQTLPFNKLVELINPVRDPSRTPLISVNFNLMEVFLQGRSYGEFELISVPSHLPGTIYDLNVAIIGRPSAGWQITLEYATDLFESATIEALAAMLRDCFDLALSTPGLRLGDLPLDPTLAARQERQIQTLKRIEEALVAHPNVAEAAAVDAGGTPYAFVIPDGTGITPLESLPEMLMRFAARTLATDEMPSGVSVLAAFPRTSRGDINRAILTPPRSASGPAAPRVVRTDPEVEAALREDWCAVLSVSELPPNASFFDLGGHSLLAVRLLARVRERWGLEPGIAAIYEHATLPDFAAYVSGQLAAAPAAKDDYWRVLPLVRAGEGTPLIAINNASTALAIAQEFPSPRPATCVRIVDGARGLDRVPESFEEIAAEFAKAVRQAHPEGPYLLFGICVHGNIALEAARCLQAEGAEILGVVVKDVWEPAFSERVLASRRMRLHDKRHAVLTRLRMLRMGTLSLSAFLGSFRLVRRTGVLHLAQRLGLIDRVRTSDLALEQERFIDHISRARNRYRPAPLDLPVLHIVTGISPRGGGFPPSLGWEDVVTGRLKTVWIDDLLVHGERRIGTAALAREIESFLGERRPG